MLNVLSLNMQNLISNGGLQYCPIQPPPLDRTLQTLVIYTDTSDYGWGAYFQGVQAQGKLPPEQADLCINSKETIAMYNGVASFEPFFYGSHLLNRSDNTTVIAFAQDMGGMSSPLRDH